MKFLFLSIFAFSSLAASLVPEFNESSFNYTNQEEAQEKVSYCYKDKETVCDEIKAQEYKLQSQYYQGSHNAMTVYYCGPSTIDKDYIAAVYELSDDYGSEFLVKKEIKPCK